MGVLALLLAFWLTQRGKAPRGLPDLGVPGLLTGRGVAGLLPERGVPGVATRSPRGLAHRPLAADIIHKEEKSVPTERKTPFAFCGVSPRAFTTAQVCYLARNVLTSHALCRRRAAWMRAKIAIMSKRDMQHLAPLAWHGRDWKKSSLSQAQVAEQLKRAKNDRTPRAIRNTPSHRQRLAEQAARDQESEDEVACDVSDDEVQEVAATPQKNPHEQAIREAEKKYQEAVGESKAQCAKKLNARAQIAELRKRISALEQAAKQHEREETVQLAEADKHAVNKEHLETLGEYFK